MTPYKERAYKAKPLQKQRTDPMWTEIFKVVGKVDKDIDKLIDWISAQGLDRLYWLAPDNHWRLKIQDEIYRRKKLKEYDDGKS